MGLVVGGRGEEEGGGAYSTEGAGVKPLFRGQAHSAISRKHQVSSGPRETGWADNEE